MKKNKQGKLKNNQKLGIAYTTTTHIFHKSDRKNVEVQSLNYIMKIYIDFFLRLRFQYLPEDSLVRHLII